MKIRQLRCFVTAAREKSLTRASEVLNVSQPAVGMQIRALEEYCGLKLFIGHSRGINLTPAGRVLAHKAQEIISLVDTIEAEMEELRDSEHNTIRLGITPAISRVLLSSLMEQCSENYPDVTLLFNQGFVNEIQGAWDAGEIDLLFTTLANTGPSIQVDPLYWEHFHVIGNKDVLDKLPSPLPVSMLADLPIVFDGRETSLKKMLSAELSREGLRFQDTIEIPTISIRREYAVKKLRFCIAPSALFMNEIESGQCGSIPIDHPSARRKMCLVGPAPVERNQNVDGVRNIILKLIRFHVANGDFGWAALDESEDA